MKTKLLCTKQKINHQKRLIFRGKESRKVEKSMKIVLEKTLGEISIEKKYYYPEDKESYLKEKLQKLVPEVSEDEKTQFI